MSNSSPAVTPLLSPRKTGTVTVTGNDALTFLQNLLSNDISLVGGACPSIHACLLTPQGKFLHDMVVTARENGGYILHTEGGERCLDLIKRLSIYKLRADVTLNANPNALPLPDESTLGTWDFNRYAHSIPDGSEDAEIGVSTLAELNLDIATVSYTKGCYIGQELVARMHNRNLGKKHLVGVEFLSSAPPSAGTILDEIGEMRSSNGQRGLILMNRETEETLKKESPDSLDFLFLERN